MQTLYSKLSRHFTHFVNFHAETEQEIKVLDALFKKPGVRSVLDIGCGVGRHSIPLAKLGYEVLGIDFSKNQINEARKLATKERSKAKFLQRDANTFSSKRKFDAAICMWTTLGEEPLIYQQVIQNAFDSLNKGGLFVADNRDWSTIPKSREQTITNTFNAPKLKIEQVMHDRYTEHFRIRDITYTINGKSYKDMCVTHTLRPEEWKKEFQKAGFKKVSIVRNYKNKKTSVLIVGQK